MEDINTPDLNAIVENYVLRTNFAQTPISSMNEFYSQGLALILTQFFEIKKSVANKRSELLNGQEITTISLEMNFRNVELSRPQTDKETPLFPADARLGGKTYSGKLSTDVHIKLTAFLKNGEAVVREEIVPKFHVAYLPIVVGSNMCHTWQMSNSALKAVGEDPTDLFGYCIIGGTEWFINNIFSRKYNIFHHFHNESEQDIDKARAEIISMPGDSFENSAETKIQYLKSGEIVFTFTSDKYFKLIGIPFYIILQLFGISSEESMILNIVPDSEFPEVDKRLRSALRDVITNGSKNFPQAREISSLVALQSYCIDVIANNYVNTLGIVDLLTRQLELQKETATLKEVFMLNLDNNILPHQGKMPEQRLIKAQYLCIGINLVLKCYFGYIGSTSRDSYDIKRIHTAGDSFSKMFKKEVNKAIVNPVKMHFEKVVTQTPFENIVLKTFTTTIDPTKLQTCIIKNLNTGISDEKGPDGKSKKNRMPSENFKRNGIPGNVNAITIARSPNSAGSYQNERAYDMRRVQPDQPVCVIQTSEGVNAGMTTNTVLGLLISKSSSKEVMKQFILNTGMIIPWNKTKTKSGTFGTISAMKVMVNGDWLGYAKNPFKLICYCQERRRGWDIISGKRIIDESFDRKHTISLTYNSTAIDFRTDRGRGCVPYVVVRNNSKFDPIGQQIIGSKADPKTGKGFRQIILLTKKHINGLRDGTITTEDLFAEGIIDYIAPDELKLVHAADTMEIFAKNADNPLIRYTHVFIPVSLISVITQFSPYLHHGPPTRIALATNHLRNACSIFSLTPNMRFDTRAYFMLHCEFPLTYTLSNFLIPTNGTHEEVMIDTREGLSGEDSLVTNKSAAERGNKQVVKYTYHKAVLEKNEEFCKPDQASVDNYKINSSYAKIGVKGYPAEGVYLEDGDIIIGKRMRITQTNSFVDKRKSEYEDKSEIYRGERARVVGINEGLDSTFKTFCSIRLEIDRPNSEGQKYASRMGQKGMTSKSLPQSKLPFNARGNVPLLIMDPHAYPTRMSVPQLIEGIKNKLAIENGKSVDATVSIPADLEETGMELERMGYDRNGLQVLYHPVTGRALKYSVFMMPTYYQRLNKFSEENSYAVSDGNRSALTRQPATGKKNEGGLRIGEMEKDCILSHGIVMFLKEKYSQDCDGMPMFICRSCGHKATVNEKEGLYTCKRCMSRSNIVNVPTRFSPQNVLNILEGMGSSISFITEPFEDESE